LILGVWTAVLAACDGVVVVRDISYDDRSGVARLDVYSPDDTAVDRPAVVVIHGGGWRRGFTKDGMADHAHRLAASGYVAFNVEYRVTPDGGEFPHAVQDCICALAFIRARAAEFGIDPARIAAFGYSAGGHLASMLGTAAAAPAVMPDCAAGGTGPVAAVISGAGPEDMTLLPQVDVVTEFVGGTQDDVPELYAAASPITYVAAGAPPFLFIHGTDDWFVDIEHSQRMQSALDDVGTTSKLLSIPGGGHLLNRGASGTTWDVGMSIDTPESWAAMLDFLQHPIGGGS
jgi:acetyl esterase/lipase